MMTEVAVGTSTSMTSSSQRSSRARRRVLVCTPFPPRLDARHGGKATSQLLLRLAERNDVALLSLCGPDDGHVDPAIATRCDSVTEVWLPARQGFSRRLAWGLGMLRGLRPGRSTAV